MRRTLSLCLLVVAGAVLHRVWPAEAIDALIHDPDVVVRTPWSSEAAAERKAPARDSERPAPAPDSPPAGALRVLFVGNSHTHRNGMPAMIAELAKAASERPIYFRMEAPDGAKLVEHVQHGRVAQQLADLRFDYLVLQEQQQWPSFGRAQRMRELEAPANTLDVLARASGARTWLFLTWARRDGDRPNRPDDSYAQMQARVLEGYADLSRAIGAHVVAVGLVWQDVQRAHPDIALWEADGSHATVAGSYLAACVFYKAFYGRSPEGNSYRASLSDDVAARIQRAAGAAQALYAPASL